MSFVDAGTDIKLIIKCGGENEVDAQPHHVLLLRSSVPLCNILELWESDFFLNISEKAILRVI